MLEHYPVLVTIGVMAAIVYATRLGGYLLGLQIRHIGWLRPVLEALPGCAFMAILVPAVRRGNMVEVLAMLCVVGIMWKTDNVVIATIVGMSVLIFGQP
ncbi:MAG: AzlD domain-containing protein [Gammaproteobacteria bacterium]|nr:AzlD domain-containing protein [Gammaproteobacteria bacterium]